MVATRPELLEEPVDFLFDDALDSVPAAPRAAPPHVSMPSMTSMPATIIHATPAALPTVEGTSTDISISTDQDEQEPTDEEQIGRAHV